MKIKKLLSLVISVIMLLSVFSTSSFAIEPQFSISDYTIEDLLEMTTAEKKVILERFIDVYNPYNLSELIEQNANSSNEESPLWSSDSSIIDDGQQMATHQLITLEALSLFIDKYGFYDIDGTSAFGVALYLAAASGLPDIDETDNSTFLGHFYNPDNEKNYLGSTSPTAKTRVGEHYAKATARLRLNVNNPDVTGADFAYVLEELGRALHYIQDACEPHHASNQVGGVTSHVEFEKYVDKNIDTLMPKVQSIPSFYYEYANNSTTQNLTHQSAILAKAYSDDVSRWNILNWDTVATVCLGDAIRGSSRLIYKIFYDNGAYFING